MSYTVLARRFRSQTFDEVLGQDAIAQTLSNAVKSGRIAHGYLFAGTRGVGKTTMARILAKSLNCLSARKPTIKPCLKCDSCVLINTGEDIDVIEIDGASNNSVDNIRQLRQNATYKPARARFKVYIIDEVHMLSVSAFNALLKILEEPPEHVKFIFATTEPNKVLATIQSRCQRFDFKSISPGVIGEQLRKVLDAEEIKFEDDIVLHLARLANGSMRDGLSVLDQLISAGAEKLTVELLQSCLGEPDREKISSLIEAVGSGEPADVLEGVDKLLGSGLAAEQILDAVVGQFRDLMVIKSTSADTELLVLTKEERAVMNKLAEKFDIPAMIYGITAMERLRWTIKNAESPRALLEALMLRLALSEHFLDLTAMVNQSGVSVKKKPIKAAVNPVEKREEPGICRSTFTCGAEIQQIKDNWQQIVKSVKSANHGTSTMLAVAEPLEVNGNKLVLGFGKSDGFSLDGCKKRSKQIESILSKVLSVEIRLSFQTLKSSKVKRADTAEDQQKAAELQGREKTEVLNEPAVKCLLAGLDANPIEITEV